VPRPCNAVRMARSCGVARSSSRGARTNLILRSLRFGFAAGVALAVVAFVAEGGSRDLTLKARQQSRLGNSRECRL
jgi:hypothetical protein